ncbi:MAG TPA: hypothetical protein VE057_16185 [Archangium sp.]|nr:hypothetical protein [Archangium sp.]
MRWRWVFAFWVWLVVATGCPETWREGGTIDRAMAQDIEEELHRHDCPLSKEEWREKCRGSPDQREQFECPHECQYRADP